VKGQDEGVPENVHSRSLYKQISARRWTKTEPGRVTKSRRKCLERTLPRHAQVDDRVCRDFDSRWL
jgi:hypothetical protein